LYFFVILSNVFLILLLPYFYTISSSSVAAELRSTDGNHFSRGVKRNSGTFGGRSKKYRTRILQTPKRGLIAQDESPLHQAAAFDKEASIACNKGRLRRFGGGVAEFGGINYPAATLKDISRAKGIELQEGTYIFVSEGTSACKVYFLQQ
jgi:hypothetical protein